MSKWMAYDITNVMTQQIKLGKDHDTSAILASIRPAKKISCATED